MRCLRRALDDRRLLKEITLDVGDAADEELRSEGRDPEVVDRDHAYGLKSLGGAKRRAIEESGIDEKGVQGGWPTHRIEVEFDCYLESYQLTASEKSRLESIVVPDVFSRPDGSDDGLTKYFYRKAIEGEPEVLFAAVHDSLELLETENDQPVLTELNELKIARILAFVADMPTEIDLLTKTQAWEIVLNSEWIHWAESTFASEIAIRRLFEQDPGFLPHIQFLVESIMSLKAMKLDEQIHTNVISTKIKARDYETLDYVTRHHPDSTLLANSLMTLAGVLSETKLLLAQAKQ